MQMWIALGIFVLTYILLLTLTKIRSYVALCSAAVFVIIGILPLSAVLGEIDWNVLMMIAGTMGTVALFIDSKMPNLLADILMDHVPNAKWAVIACDQFTSQPEYWQEVSAYVGDAKSTLHMILPEVLLPSGDTRYTPFLRPNEAHFLPHPSQRFRHRQPQPFSRA